MKKAWLAMVDRKARDVAGYLAVGLWLRHSHVIMGNVPQGVYVL